MTWLVEDPITIILLGVAIEVILGVVLLQTRRSAAILGMLAILVITIALLAVERFVVTDSTLWPKSGTAAIA